MINFIIKRDGTKEEFFSVKVNGWGQWASKSLGDRVDWSAVVMKAVASLPEECSSVDLQHTLIRQCLNMNSWPYNRMAGRLYAATIHKDLYEKDNIPTVREVHAALLKAGHMVRLDYSEEEYTQVEKWIKHSRDFTYAHFQLYQMRYKYALRDRVTGKELESPQFCFMRMAMALAETQPAERRMNDVFEFYQLLSKNIINAPTPNYVNLGSPLNGYASCCLYEVKDTIASLAIGDHIAYIMTASASGIGNTLHTRSIGDPVRGGLIAHNGKLPYYRAMVNAVRANIQNGRAGACTTFWNAFDPEAKDIAVLRNPRTTVDKQILGMDYAQMSNKFIARKVARKEEIFLFNCFTAPDLYESFFLGDETLFEQLYAKYEADPTFKKTYLPARELMLATLEEKFETGRAYQAFMSEINRHTPFKDPIHSSNLCVVPETLLLTDKGHQSIGMLAGQTVNIWNGQEYSSVKVVKTGERQELRTVEVSSGLSLECTPYHKWYIKGENGKVTELRTEQLVPGDKLIDFSLPLIEGTENLNRAYLNGFFSSNGLQLPFGQQQISLYGSHREFKERLGETFKWIDDEDTKESIALTSGLRDRSFVPNASFTVESRLLWLAGALDASASVYRKNTQEMFSMMSTRHDYLIDIVFMLQTLGISSKVVFSYNASNRLMPEEGVRGEKDFYQTRKTWRLVISSDQTQKLYAMGLKTVRLAVERKAVQDALETEVTVVNVLDNHRKDDTYCVTEPKRHMAVFNGILSGNCMETVLATEAYSEMMDLYSDKSVGEIVFTGEDDTITYHYKAPERIKFADGHVDAAQNLKVGDTFYPDTFKNPVKVKEILKLKREPEVALCSLAAIVVSKIDSDEEYEKAMYYSLLMIDKCIHKSTYQLPHVGYTGKNRLSAAVGMTDFAHHMAKKGLKYSTLEGKKEMHRIAEKHMFFAIKASLKLAKELGNAPWIHRTKWADGWLPIDTYTKNVDKIVPNDLQYDWEGLRQEVIEQGGIRNSTLVAYMPVESSSKASGTANSIYPVRDLALMKTDNDITTYWCAPDADLLDYELAYDIPTEDMIDSYGIFQKFTDQSISADFYRRIIGAQKVSSDEMLTHYLRMVSVGMKTTYYQNTMTTKPVVLSAADKKEEKPSVPSAVMEAVALLKSPYSAVIPPEQLIPTLITQKNAQESDQPTFNRQDGDESCAGGVCSM